MNAYCVVDLETNGRTTYKRICNPLDSANWIGIVAKKEPSDKARLLCNLVETKFTRIDKESAVKFILANKPDILVGQNFKFDMLWLWSVPEFQQWIANGGKVWDTMLAEYLLTGQDPNISKSLNTLSAKYGGTQKDSNVKFSDDNQLKDMDPELVLPYASGDVINTEIVFLEQLKLAKKHKMEKIISVHMRHVLAVTEIEHNGMCIQHDDLAELRLAYAAQSVDYREHAEDLMAEVIKDPDLKVNAGSARQLSAVLFGGELSVVCEVKKKLPDGRYDRYKCKHRKDEIKTRKEKQTRKYEGLQVPYKEDWVSSSGVVSTSSAVLTYLLDNLTENDKAKELIKTILEFRKVEKILNTYCLPLRTLINRDTGCVHSEFNMTLTRTGRLSSKNPNAQNCPPEVRGVISSRWGDKGVICEADFGQLEIVVQAWLTQCHNMIKDIENGVDFHCKRLAYAEDKPYEKVVQLVKESEEWKLKRKKAKIISFQKAYGAREERVAESTGLDLEVVKKVFRLEDMEYPEIASYYRGAASAVENSLRMRKELIDIVDKHTNKKITMAGQFKGYGHYQSILGRLYTFYQKAVLTSKGKVFRYFSMPDIQDYPVQGTAADIVAMKVSELFEFFNEHRDKCLLINEVHDAVIFDVKKEHLDWTKQNIKAIMESINKSFMENFGLRFNVPLKVDIVSDDKWSK